MSLTEVLGFVTGALCVWFATRQNVWTFPVGIANNIAFVALFAPSGLYADAALQLVYLVLAALGWQWWVRRGPDHSVLRPTETPRAAWPWLAGGLALGTAGLWWLLASQTDSTVPGYDALTTALSLVAQVMLNRKWVQNWWVWITADVIYVGLYAYKDLWLTAALYLGFIALCGYGLRQWRAAQAREARVGVAA